MKYLAILLLLGLVSCNENKSIAELEQRIYELESKFAENDTSLILNELKWEHRISQLEAARLSDSLFGIITRRVIIVNDSSIEMVSLGSTIDGKSGGLWIYNNKGESIVSLNMEKESGGGIIWISNKKGKKRIVLGASDKYGNLSLFSKNETSSISLQDGVVRVYNKSGEEVGYFGNGKGNDGLIFLNDRYGEVGWSESGKVK